MTYWLSVLRFVPDPARGEFVNVGAIAGNDDNEDWEIRAVSNWQRAKKFDEGGTLPAVMNFVSQLQLRAEMQQEELLDRGERLTVARLRQFSTEMRNLVQISEPVPVVATSAEHAVNLAFQQLVIDPPQRHLTYAKKGPAVKAARLAYQAKKLSPIHNPRVRSGPYDTEFDFAIANGQAVQLVRCWSFQLPDQRSLADEIKAWVWSVRALRNHGPASLSAETTDADLVVDPEVDVQAIFLPPAVGQTNHEAYDVARDAFASADVGIEQVSVENVETVATRALQLLQAPH